MLSSLINDAQQFNRSRNRLPAACLIYVNKERLTRLHPYVKEVTINLKRNVSGTATIVIDSFRDERGFWLVQDSGLLRPWDEVEIFALFGTKDRYIIHGYVREVRQEYPDDMSGAQVTIEVQDDLLKLDREQLHDTLSEQGEEKADGVIARELADKVDMKCVTERDNQGNELSLTPAALHINTTPIKLLRERAEANGYELYTRKGILYFHPPRLSVDPQPTIRVYAGSRTNCINFSLQHDGHKPDIVRLLRDPEKKKNNQQEIHVGQNGQQFVQSNRENVLRNSKDNSTPPMLFEPDQKSLGKTVLTSKGKGLRPFVWTIDCPQGASDVEAENRAQAKANENQFKIKANGVLDGSIYGYVLLPHLPVKVEGIGKAYSGIFYVDAVTHKFTREGYEQHFELLKNGLNDGE